MMQTFLSSSCHFSVGYPFPTSRLSKQTHTNTHKQTHTHKQQQKHAHKQTNKHTQTNKQTNTHKQTNKQTNTHKQTNKQTHTNKQTNKHTHTNSNRNWNKMISNNYLTVRVDQNLYNKNIYCLYLLLLLFCFISIVFATYLCLIGL